MENVLSIDALTEEQLRTAASHMAPRSDGWDAAKHGDWDEVRAALREAVRDGFTLEDFVW